MKKVVKQEKMKKEASNVEPEKMIEIQVSAKDLKNLLIRNIKLEEKENVEKIDLTKAVLKKIKPEKPEQKVKLEKESTKRKSFLEPVKSPLARDENSTKSKNLEDKSSKNITCGGCKTINTFEDRVFTCLMCDKESCYQVLEQSSKNTKVECIDCGFENIEENTFIQCTKCNEIL